MKNFIIESNKIEGIFVEPSEALVALYTDFVQMPLSTGAVIDFQRLISPDNGLRTRFGMDVRVGQHIAPCGGPKMLSELGQILGHIRDDSLTPFSAHRAFLTLHPFMDGNGRTARAIWLNMMLKAPLKADRIMAENLGFLHTFYYQTLADGDSK